MFRLILLENYTTTEGIKKLMALDKIISYGISLSDLLLQCSSFEKKNVAKRSVYQEFCGVKGSYNSKHIHII